MSEPSERTSVERELAEVTAKFAAVVATARELFVRRVAASTPESMREGEVERIARFSVEEAVIFVSVCEHASEEFYAGYFEQSEGP